MRKTQLGIEETLKYRRSMIIEVPDEMTESELNNILDNVQMRANAIGDIPHLLEKENRGIKVIESSDKDMSIPSDTEVEIDDLDFLD